MATKSAVFKQTVKKKGFFSYSDLYGFCFSFLKNNGYSVKEKEYTEKASDFGKEIMIDWEGARKVNDYFKNVIYVKWHILGLNDAEVERGGRKEKTNKGELKLTISADLVKDYEDRYEKTPLSKMLRGIYDKHIIRETTEDYEGRLVDVVVEMVQEVKAFLDMSV